LDPLTAAFLAFVVVVIAQAIFHKRELGIDDFVGAFAGHIMTGIAGGRLYAPFWQFAPRSFGINPDVARQLELSPPRNSVR
jgi:ammonia channel protein AmtB